MWHSVARNRTPAYLVVTAGLALLVPHGHASAQPSPEWRQIFDRYSFAFVHTASVAREKQKDGGTTVKVWTATNYEPPMELEGMRVGSTKVLVTLYCSSHVFDAEYTIYSAPNFGGRQLPLPRSRNTLRYQAVEPETFEYALQDKYCSSWAFWR